MQVTRLHLSDTHPDPGLAWANGDTPVHGYLVDHPDGLILVDTGVGEGSELIDSLYHPDHHDLGAALAAAGHQVHDVAMVINSHLHFDHCGHNRLFAGVPTLIQRAEHTAAKDAHYGIREWWDFLGARIELIDGDTTVASGVRVVATPGHTPGHQSIVVDTDEGAVVVAAQAAETTDAFAERRTDPHSAGTEAEQITSMDRLHSLNAARYCFSHDPRDWAPTPTR